MRLGIICILRMRRYQNNVWTQIKWKTWTWTRTRLSAELCERKNKNIPKNIFTTFEKILFFQKYILGFWKNIIFWKIFSRLPKKYFSKNSIFSVDEKIFFEKIYFFKKYFFINWENIIFSEIFFGQPRKYFPQKILFCPPMFSMELANARLNCPKQKSAF